MTTQFKPKAETFDAIIHADYGIQKNNLMYNSRALRNLLFELVRKQNTPKPPQVRCSYSHRDITQIAVTNPNTKEVFLVPCTDKRIKPGTSLKKYRSQRNTHQTTAGENYLSANKRVFDLAKGY